MFDAKILADSLSPAGWRLTTFQIRIPRFILAEINTHRVCSRNSASSRAIPVGKRIVSVKDDPFVPEAFGKNQRGMQSSSDLELMAQEEARGIWLEARDAACKYARALADLEVHKQWANRLLEPFAWTEVIVSATHWRNFYNRRNDPDAQPEFRTIAAMMLELHKQSVPYRAPAGWWHLPMVDDHELAIGMRAGFASMQPTSVDDDGRIINWAQVSAGRCARVSYLTQDGRRDPHEDMALYSRLVAPGHVSPLEHPAMAFGPGASVPIGNYWGWLQLRKTIPEEHALPQRDGSHQWDDGPHE